LTEGHAGIKSALQVGTLQELLEQIETDKNVDADEDAFPNDPSASTDTDGDGLPDDWNPGYTALDSTTGLLVDRDDDNDGYTDKEEEEAGTDSLDAGDQPVSGMGIILIKQAIDAAAARSQQ
jgi:hypothetical protein